MSSTSPPHPRPESSSRKADSSPRTASVDWALILWLASAGVPVAALTIFGLIGASVTGWLALLVPAAVGIVAGVRRPDRALTHGFLAALIGGIVFVELQALFLPLYFDNNPQYGEIAIPFGWPARVFTAVFGPLNGVLAGLIGGTAAYMSGRLAQRSIPRSQVP